MTATAVVIRPEDQAVLVLPSGLPRVEAAQKLWFHQVGVVLRAFREQLGIEAYVLQCLGAEPNYLMTCVGDVPAEARWVQDFDHPLVDAAREHLALPPDAPLTPAWTRPDWYAGALAWIDRHVERTGVPAQVRSWGLSNVLRVPTTTGDVYFKALAHRSTVVLDRADAAPLLFAHEPQLLDRLSTERPGQVVRPIAVDQDRVWMLLPDLGMPLAQQAGAGLWIDTLRSHARLQRSFTDSPGDLLAMSCFDRGLGRLAGELERVLGSNELTTQLTGEERDRLSSREPELREAVAELASIGVPETLLHGDLHPGNVGVRDERTFAFDWTDAAVSHPFLDLVTFVEEGNLLSGSQALKDAYLGVWQDFAPLPALRHGLDLAARVGSLYQAVTYLHLVDNLAGPSRDSMANGGVGWLRNLVG
ncbi:phosphotransferase [Kribbella sp. ALI-6-A]|uniref:phosphotransferase n=1 Tax=Kribbella sp. ALI-6-A TaxID=1933817 RepID=UPI000A073BB8|nr:phosphotransferase [Kribbella sp. ALI-6-A]